MQGSEAGLETEDPTARCTRRRRRIPYLEWSALLLIVGTTAACEDFSGLIPWSPIPTTVQLYSLSRGEWVGHPGAYDFIHHRLVVVEAFDEIDTWDVGVAEDEDGMRLVLPAFFQGLGGRSGVQRVDHVAFEELTIAPSEGYDSLSTAAIEGAVYAFRTRALGDCVFYGKLEVLETDLVSGLFTFQFVANPNCNHRSLTAD